MKYLALAFGVLALLALIVCEAFPYGVRWKDRVR